MGSNIKVAKQGGTVAKKARNEIEKQTGESVIGSDNKKLVTDKRRIK